MLQSNESVNPLLRFSPSARDQRFKQGQAQTDSSSYLLCCRLRQKPLPLSTGDVEVGAAHACVTADAHARPGKARVLTKAALLQTR